MSPQRTKINLREKMNVHPEIQEYFNGRQQVDRELADLYQKVRKIKDNQGENSRIDENLISNSDRVDVLI